MANNYSGISDPQLRALILESTSFTKFHTSHQMEVKPMSVVSDQNVKNVTSQSDCLRLPRDISMNVEESSDDDDFDFGIVNDNYASMGRGSNLMLAKPEMKVPGAQGTSSTFSNFRQVSPINFPTSSSSNFLNDSVSNLVDDHYELRPTNHSNVATNDTKTDVCFDNTDFPSLGSTHPTPQKASNDKGDHPRRPKINRKGAKNLISSVLGIKLPKEKSLPHQASASSGACAAVPLDSSDDDTYVIEEEYYESIPEKQNHIPKGSSEVPTVQPAREEFSLLDDCDNDEDSSDVSSQISENGALAVKLLILNLPQNVADDYLMDYLLSYGKVGKLKLERDWTFSSVECSLAVENEEILKTLIEGMIENGHLLFEYPDCDKPPKIECIVIKQEHTKKS